ncbi:MAG: tetratricopeptide repeat protein, partial [Chloroflexi bacterium]|nr:tetratricopeptide repeat protein [Chloroflexota bacterium]
IKEQLGDQQGKSATLHAMAGIYVVRGDLDGAMRLYKESLAIKEQLGDLQGKSATLAMMGQVLALRGENEPALRAFLEALTILVRMRAADVVKVVEIIQSFKNQLGEGEFRKLWKRVTGQEELPEWLR